MGLRYVVAILVMLFCMLGIHVEGKRRGFIAGAEFGALSVIEDIQKGRITVDGNKLIFGDDASFGLFHKNGEHLTDIDLRELDFTDD